MDKHLTEIESWLQNYRILDRVIESLYRQSQKPHLQEAFLKMAPKGDKNMAVKTDAVRVDGGRARTLWALSLPDVERMVGEISQQISTKIQACLTEQYDMLCVVEETDLNDKERMYVEQRYFEGLTVKEMEFEGCMRTTLNEIKISALQKIYDTRLKKAKTA